MKRICTLFMGMFMLAGATRAGAQSIQFGAVGGAAISTLVGSDTDGADSRTTPLFGLQLVWQPASVLGFEAGAVYVSKGASDEFEGGVDGALSITYLEVPALLRIALPLQGSGVRPVLMLGGTLGLKSGCQVEASSGSASANVDCDDSAFGGTLDLKSIDLGLSAGAAIDIPAGTRLVISPGARYTRGLTDIGDTADNADAKNSSIELRVALRMRF
jgi:outer membrane protein with beta-barrel domain